jgi:PhnB protein
MRKKTAREKVARPNVMPQLVVAGADDAIRFYTKAFGAKETMRFAPAGAGGTILHAELDIAGCLVALSEEGFDPGPKRIGGSPVVLTLEVPDVDAVAARAVKLGAKLLIPVADQFYGYRQGRIADPFGHLWILSTKQRAMTVAEMEGAMARWRDG